METHREKVKRLYREQQWKREVLAWEMAQKIIARLIQKAVRSYR